MGNGILWDQPQTHNDARATRAVPGSGGRRGAQLATPRRAELVATVDFFVVFFLIIPLKIVIFHSYSGFSH